MDSLREGMDTLHYVSFVHSLNNGFLFYFKKNIFVKRIPAQNVIFFDINTSIYLYQKYQYFRYTIKNIFVYL